VRQKLSLFFVACICNGVCAAQESERSNLVEKAVQEFRAKDFAAAERDLRELTKADSSNLMAYAYLGHALFRQEKFAEAVGPYEKARALEIAGKTLPQSEQRVLVDQLVMSYGIAGQLSKAHKLLDEAVQQDPGYPLNYYNRACAFAEEGDKAKALANLDLAFRWKANVLKGEQMPDPRADSSFQKYVRDSDFVNLMKKLGLQ
jgi:Tfp pilus assembly protein PilF